MSLANSGSLGDLQRAFQDYLLANDDGFAASVRDTRKANRVTLLEVYREGYALRLIEVLTNDYPGVVAMCGPADFDHFARAYIAAHPSRHPSVRWFGRHLAEFAAGTPPYDGAPAVAEMARFEWALGEAFDMPDLAPISADALIALPPDAWETLSFKALPSLRLLRFAHSVARAWQRREEVRSGDLEVERTPEPVTWAIWRPELISHFRSLEPDETEMLKALIEGRPFPELCGCVVAHVGEDQAAARAAGLLRGWVEVGMVASYSIGDGRAVERSMSN
jgi:hypothetical protein